MNISWNADEYAEGFGFVPRYGLDVLSLLEGKPGMSVVDLGCGNGAITQRIADEGFDVVGVDASEEMIGRARAEHPGVSFVHADALSYIPDEPVDAVFSNAVFHWIDDHEALCARLACVIKPGGQLVFECGGYGCTAQIHGALNRSFTQRGLSYETGFNFSTIGRFSALLEMHGFLPKTALLFDRPTPLMGEDGMFDWMRMFVKTPFDAVGIDPEGAEADAIRKEAVSALRPLLFVDGTWTADYVRLRMRAVKEAPC